jgi:acyl-CoA synthetase (AMP-forming)/AMP-acid ligase II
VPGVRAGSVIAFSRPGEHSEELVIAAETREQSPERLDELRREVTRTVRSELALAPAEVALVPAGSLPKTSSGKVQRLRARQQYLDGTLGRLGDRSAEARGGLLGIAGHLLRSLWTRVRAVFGRRRSGRPS